MDVTRTFRRALDRVVEQLSSTALEALQTGCNCSMGACPGPDPDEPLLPKLPAELLMGPAPDSSSLRRPPASEGGKTKASSGEVRSEGHVASSGWGEETLDSAPWGRGSVENSARSYETPLPWPMIAHTLDILDEDEGVRTFEEPEFENWAIGDLKAYHALLDLPTCFSRDVCSEKYKCSDDTDADSQIASPQAWFTDDKHVGSASMRISMDSPAFYGGDSRERRCRARGRPEASTSSRQRHPPPEEESVAEIGSAPESGAPKCKVPGLWNWLNDHILEGYEAAANKWCIDMGAATLKEIAEHIDEFAEALELKQLERQRVKRWASQVLQPVHPAAVDPKRHLARPGHRSGTKAKVVPRIGIRTISPASASAVAAQTPPPPAGGALSSSSSSRRRTPPLSATRHSSASLSPVGLPRASGRRTPGSAAASVASGSLAGRERRSPSVAGSGVGMYQGLAEEVAVQAARWQAHQNGEEWEEEEEELPLSTAGSARYASLSAAAVGYQQEVYML